MRARRWIGGVAMSLVLSAAGCDGAGSNGNGPASASPTPRSSIKAAADPIRVSALLGRLVFSRDNGDVFVSNADGTGVAKVTTRRGPEFDPTWSPDGRNIAYRDSTHGINHNDEIYVMNADGSNPRNITRDPSNDWGPAWSPDGTLIAFNSDRDLLPQIYVMRQDGSHVRRLSEIEGEYPAWSPDGTRIVFMSMRPGAAGNDPNYDVFVMNADGSGLKQLTDWPGEDGWAAWSPDGTRIAFTTTQDNHWQTGDAGPFFDIYLMNPDGTGKRPLTRIFAMFPVWSPDGSAVMFAGSPLPMRTEALWVIRPDGTGLAQVVPGSFPDWVPA